MSELKIRCPKCGKVTGTGFWMDKETFKTSILLGNRVNCRHCGYIIVWNKEDVI